MRLLGWPFARPFDEVEEVTGCTSDVRDQGNGELVFVLDVEALLAVDGLVECHALMFGEAPAAERARVREVELIVEFFGGGAEVRVWADVHGHCLGDRDLHARVGAGAGGEAGDAFGCDGRGAVGEGSVVGVLEDGDEDSESAEFLFGVAVTFDDHGQGDDEAVGREDVALEDTAVDGEAWAKGWSVGRGDANPSGGDVVNPSEKGATLVRGADVLKGLVQEVV